MFFNWKKWQMHLFLRQIAPILFLQINLNCCHFVKSEPLMVFTTLAHISDESWQRWEQFKVDNCRHGNEEGDNVAGLPLNNTEHAYFHWEQGEFHRHLRQRLMPETGGDNLRPLVGSKILGLLDPRLFASRPKSLCKSTSFRSRESVEEEQRRMAKLEQAMFEDSIIDRVFPNLPDAYGEVGEEYEEYLN